MSLEMVGLPTPEQTDTPTEPEPTPNPELSEPITEPTGNNESPEQTPTEVVTEQQAQVDEVLAALIGAIAPAHLATQHMKIFVYGANGCGKTVFAAQAPGVLIAD